MNRTIRSVALALLLMIGAAACGDDDDDASEAGAPVASGENTLSITEREYEFELGGDLEAGTVSIAVSNEGAEIHEIGMAKLADGKTVDDARAAVEAATGDEEEDLFAGIVEEETVIDDLGGIQLPGTSYTITGSGIEAGDYLLLCFIPDSTGTPHFSLGMLDGFTVAEGEADEVPEADVAFTATDDGLEGPDSVEAGETTIEVVNDSSVNREIVLMKIADGRSIDDVGAWFESGGDGAPDPAASPLEFLAFVFDAGQDRHLTVELTAGQWSIASADPERPFDGRPTEDPHAILFTVT